MSCRKNCPHQNGQYSFKFVNSQRSINSAQEQCKKLGDKGSLASHLSETDYETIKSCCISEEPYWIGLINDETCKTRNGNTPSSPYHWIGKRACTNARPLQITYQPSNGQCHAVAITISSQKRINPRFNICTHRFRFICKVSTPKPTPKATTAKTTTAKTTRKKRPSTSLLQPTTPKNGVPTNAQFNATAISTTPATISKATKFNQNNDITSASAGNAEAIAGAILGSIVVILLVVLLLWRHKQGNNRKCPKLFGRQKKNKILRMDVNQSNQAHPSTTYYSISPSSLTHEPDNLSRENINDSANSTPNEEEGAYQTISYENSETSGCVYAIVDKSKKNESRRGYSPTTNPIHEIQNEEQIDDSNSYSYIQSNAHLAEVGNDVEVEDQVSALYASVNKTKKKIS